MKVQFKEINFSSIFSCDLGYFGDICVPASVLPCEIMDTFNQKRNDAMQPIKDHHATALVESVVDDRLWWSHRGVTISDRCGVLVAGTAMLFNGVGSN